MRSSALNTCCLLVASLRSQVLELTKEWTNKWNETQNILKVGRILIAADSAEKRFYRSVYLFIRFVNLVCSAPAGGDSGPEEGGDRRGAGLRAASPHRHRRRPPQHRHHPVSPKGQRSPDSPGIRIGGKSSSVQAFIL